MGRVVLVCFKCIEIFEQRIEHRVTARTRQSGRVNADLNESGDLSKEPLKAFLDAFLYLLLLLME